MAGDDRPERSERVREPPQGLKFPSGGYLKDHAALAREQDPAAVKKHRSAPQPFGKDQGGRRHLRHIDPAVEPVADHQRIGAEACSIERIPDFHGYYSIVLRQPVAPFHHITGILVFTNVLKYSPCQDTAFLLRRTLLRCGSFYQVAAAGICLMLQDLFHGYIRFLHHLINRHKCSGSP